MIPRRHVRRCVGCLLLAGMFTGAPRVARAQTHGTMDGSDVVEVFPVFPRRFMCLQHPAGQRRAIGDALGADCLVVHFGGPSGRWPVFFHGSGAHNADWYGWKVPVLAPFDGVVDSVHINPKSNRPGTLEHARASVIVFRRADGVRVLYAHLQEITVAPGDSVHAGEPVARVGNNGPAYLPHTHVAAWRAGEPLQLEFDARKIGRGRR